MDEKLLVDIDVLLMNKNKVPVDMNGISPLLLPFQRKKHNLNS